VVASEDIGSRATRTRIFDIEGTPVKCFEMTDGTRLWLCECAAFQERAGRHLEGFCVNTAVAIMRWIEDGSIELR
jgi:hypothetical protein